MTYREFTIGAGCYRARPLDPIVQGHLARRLAPAVLAFAPMLRKVLGGEPIFPTDRMDALAGFNALLPFVEFLGQQSTENHTFIVETCLSVIERQRAGRWVPCGGRRDASTEDMTGADVFEAVSFVIAGEMGRLLGQLMERLPSAPLPKVKFDA